MLTGDRRDLGGAGIHFSPKGLYEHGHMWADLVGNYLEPLLNSQALTGAIAVGYSSQGEDSYAI